MQDTFFDPPLLAVEPGRRNVLRVRLAAAWSGVTIGAMAIDQLLLRATSIHGVLTVLSPLVGSVKPNAPGAGIIRSG